ncbi:hypothetical protein 2F2_23 [uncultured Caudovirales phage]|uniref:Uncharacterized protein n=1 Tax=uncultured Caudovirales phage TaxID=2100421 RepID=A0A2H4JBY1_9CAUD|nr:hypothetical protein 2F2_23 [uncultured Caudovirales phage]
MEQWLFAFAHRLEFLQMSESTMQAQTRPTEAKLPAWHTYLII